MKANLKVSLKDIEAARERIKSVVQKTRLKWSSSASQELGLDVFFKFENEQRTGSFKIRGALNKFRLLKEAGEKRGLIASSAGNHAQGVALAARECGLKATIVMPKRAPVVKQLATEGYGAEVILHGEIYDDAYQLAIQLAKERNLLFIPPFEDEQIIAGQGTLGLEVFEDMADLDSIVLPIGGGGLIAGVAIALKTLNPKIKIFGAVAENVPGMLNLFKNRTGNQGATHSSIADGISVKVPSPVMCETFLKKYVDDIVSISEDQIAEAILFLLERAKTVVEGSGAISFAALRHGKLNLGKKTCAVLSGGNIDMNLIAQILDRGLTMSGRIARIGVVVVDRPGVLQSLTKIFADKESNILEVDHDRMARHLQIREALITFTVETKSEAHLESLQDALQRSGIAQRIIQDP